MKRGDEPFWYLGRPLLAILLTCVAGTLGYLLVEGWSVGDAVYTTVITFSTVGYHEVQPLSPAGRLFTVILILVGVGALFYSFSASMAFIFQGQLTHRWARSRMERQVRQARDHFILCGYGRVGQQIARELKRAGAA